MDYKGKEKIINKSKTIINDISVIQYVCHTRTYCMFFYLVMIQFISRDLNWTFR